MLRRLANEQPENFAFTSENDEWVDEQIAKYPEGRAQSAVIPVLWRAQEQEGWLSRRAIEAVADRLGMPYIRALEVASFYFMFQLSPVGKTAHVQVCGTTSCMLRGAEDLVALCKKKIAANAHELSEDSQFSWEEVECLGACTNAPMVQIGKDYYEDLTPEKLEEILDAMARGDVPVAGPQNGRFAAEPLGGVTSLKGAQVESHNASQSIALELGDSIARIEKPGAVRKKAPIVDLADDRPSADKAAVRKNKVEKVRRGAETAVKTAASKIKKATGKVKKTIESKASAQQGEKPELLKAARGGQADDLKLIKGVGPKLEKLLRKLGVYHFDQVASWKANEVAWIDENLEGFKGRIERDEWIAQAKLLAKGELTEFAKKQKK